MKIGLFTEFSYPGKSEHQLYAEVLEQIAVADELGYDFFSITESYGKDLFSCSPFPLGLYVAAAQRARRIRFLTGIISMPIHHPAMLASQVAAADLLTEGRIMLGLGRGHPWVIGRMNVDAATSSARFEEGIRMLVEIFKGELYRKTRRRVLADPRLQTEPAADPAAPSADLHRRGDDAGQRDLCRQSRPGIGAAGLSWHSLRPGARPDRDLSEEFAGGQPRATLCWVFIATLRVTATKRSKTAPSRCRARPMYFCAAD